MLYSGRSNLQPKLLSKLLKLWHSGLSPESLNEFILDCNLSGNFLLSVCFCSILLPCNYNLELCYLSNIVQVCVHYFSSSISSCFRSVTTRGTVLLGFCFKKIEQSKRWEGIMKRPLTCLTKWKPPDMINRYVEKKKFETPLFIDFPPYFRKRENSFQKSSWMKLHFIRHMVPLHECFCMMNPAFGKCLMHQFCRSVSTLYHLWFP